jgi:hypothetical protein
VQRRQTYCDSDVSDPVSTEAIRRATSHLQLRHFDDLHCHHIQAAGYQKSFIWGSVAYSPVGDTVYVNYLPEALATGNCRAAPELMVVGKGLETIQGALDLQKKGVSAKKVAVSFK